ncbi:hypothetical protein AB6A40_009890 [Gnathostoma spinigerum]|uniref:Protein kinase domain-containing protein n=1 Tax=Gnathostoma spinigerum TaxID=75299 RepID=A0ABD6ETK6_9BILA
MFQFDAALIPRVQTKPTDSFSLDPGTVICGKNGKFCIQKKLGRCTYKVKQNGTENMFFLRIESLASVVDLPSLKTDVFVLESMAKLSDKCKKHFLQLIDKGRSPGKCNFLVTNMADINLEDLRSKRLKKDFKPTTALALSMHTLHGIHDVHTCGYIHRNISPSNFLIGLGKDNCTVFITGFSFGYKYHSPQKSEGAKKSR